MITAKDVKKLRDITGAGMMDCKKALTEAEGNIDAAIDLLRKKGQKVSAKRADRDAKEGLIVALTSNEGATAVMAEINCETDFVARNDDFVTFATSIAKLVIDNNPADNNALSNLELNGRPFDDAIMDMTGKIGEKIDVRRFTVESVEKGKVIPYIHPGAQLGVLVQLTGDGDLDAVGRDVAMQVAAMNPIATRTDDVPQEVKDKELSIGREIALAEGKPEQIVDKIATGKLNRFYRDNVLLEQSFVKDSSMTVKAMLKKANADVIGFTRFSLGN